MWLCPSPKWWSLFPLILNQGGQYDYFHGWNTAEVMLWELQGWVIKGKTAFSLFAGTHVYGPLYLRPVKGLPTLRLSCYEETKSNREATCNIYIIPAQGADMLVKKPLDDSSPQPLSHPKLQVFLTEALDIIEQRLTIPTVPCLNFWPTEPISIKTWLPDNKLGSNSNWKNNLYSNSNWKNHQETALNFK